MINALYSGAIVVVLWAVGEMLHDAVRLPWLP